MASLLCLMALGAQGQTLLSYTMDDANYAPKTELAAGPGTIFFGQDKRETSTIAACGYGYKSDGDVQNGTGTKYAKLTPSRALQAGDVISITAYATSNPDGSNYGVAIYSDLTEDDRVSILYLTANNKNKEEVLSYTVTAGDGLDGATTFYVFRAPSKSTYMTEFSVVGAGGSSDPSISASNVEVKCTESGVPATATIDVTGVNLSGSSLTATLSPAVSGLSVSLSSAAITDGSITTTATVRFVATENVDKATTTLILSDGTTSKEVTITYSALVEEYVMESISTEQTWDFSKVKGEIQFADDDKKAEHLYANLLGVDYPADFNSKALAFTGEYPIRANSYAQNGTLRFNTTVPGTVTVWFSNTGGSNKNRYVNVNGTTGEVEADGTTTREEDFEVQAGDVIITGLSGTPSEDGNYPAAALRYMKVKFVPSEEVGPTAVTLSFPEEAYTVIEGEDFTAPQLIVEPALPMALAVTYASSDVSVATVDATTGDVTIVGPGTTTITATWAGDDSYASATASYTLTVESATLVPVTPYYVYNFSDFEAKTYAQSDDERVVNNLGILANGKDIVIDENNKTVGGVKYTQRLKFGGAGSAIKQNVHFKVSGACQVSVVAVSGSTGAKRKLGITIAGKETVNTTNDVPAIYSAVYKGTDEADVYIYSKDNGINIYAIIIEEASEYDNVEYTFNSYGYGTFYYSDADYAIPEGVEASIVTGLDGRTLVQEALTNVIPAGTAVVLKGEPSSAVTFTALVPEPTVSTTSDNLLRGTDEAETIDIATAEFYYYVLSAKEGKVGFYWATEGGGSFENAAHKAYLALTPDQAAQAPAFFFDGTTGISAVDAAADSNAPMYNLAGQRVTSSYKGVVIRNGKKVMNK